MRGIYWLFSLNPRFCVAKGCHCPLQHKNDWSRSMRTSSISGDWSRLAGHILANLCNMGTLYGWLVPYVQILWQQLGVGSHAGAAAVLSGLHPPQLLVLWPLLGPAQQHADQRGVRQKAARHLRRHESRPPDQPPAGETAGETAGGSPRCGRTAVQSWGCGLQSMLCGRYGCSVCTQCRETSRCVKEILVNQQGRRHQVSFFGGTDSWAPKPSYPGTLASTRISATLFRKCWKMQNLQMYQ